LAELKQIVIATEEQDPAQALMPAIPDFRVRVARERREQMRARLLAATFTVYQSASHSAPAVIDDVIRSAGVSRGTFYKYFVSVEEAVAELGSQMALDLLQSIKTVYCDLHDSAERVVGGALMPLARAAMQPRWGAFTSRVDFTQQRLSRHDQLLGFTMDSLASAREEGVLRFGSLTAAVDVVVGIVVEGMRRSANGHAVGKAYILDLLVIILSGLGAERLVAVRIATEAWNRLVANANILEWWADLPE
jgi:AcrR family transcriptional regulator